METDIHKEQLEGIFKEAHRQLRPRTPLPDVQVEFFPFAGLNHTARLNDGKLMIRVSDIFTDAPAEIHHSLALILLAKLYRKQIDDSHHRAYRLFILGGEIQARARMVRNSRCRPPRNYRPRGRHINLDELFGRLNEKHLNGSIPKPKLSWSAKRSRYVLGRYDATHDTIYISRLFDSPDIPSYVAAYVMFHEMLHIKHQSHIQDCRVISHTPEFRCEERTFPEYEQAKLWLRLKM